MSFVRNLGFLGLKFRVVVEKDRYTKTRSKMEETRSQSSRFFTPTGLVSRLHSWFTLLHTSYTSGPRPCVIHELFTTKGKTRKVNQPLFVGIVDFRPDVILNVGYKNQSVPGV